jgi:hypothetical protein
MRKGVAMKLQLSVKRILVDGTLLSMLLTLIFFGCLYTPEVRAAGGEVDVPAHQLVVFYALFFGTVVGVTLYSNARLSRENGGWLSFWTASAHSTLLLLFLAVWDLLITDWLIFVTIRPDFIVIPGTEEFAGYEDYWFHFEVAFLGLVQWLSIIIGGLILGGLATVLPGGRQ